MISTTEFGIEATWAYIYDKTKLVSQQTNNNNNEDNIFNPIYILIADQPKKPLNVSNNNKSFERRDFINQMFSSTYVTAHAVLDAKEVELEDGTIERIVKLRNHWELDTTMLGDWSESSHKWTPQSR